MILIVPELRNIVETISISDLLCFALYPPWLIPTHMIVGGHL